MRFGVFDHMDESGQDQADYYETRLKLVEAMDRLGYHSYHTAEHHGTPLGLAPSPSVYLSAVAQRTKRLKFGPLVYLPALYHPMRLAEEICMLDQMSRGRMQIGIGSGAVWIEQKLYDVDPETVRGRYQEARDIVLQALTSEEVNFKGQYFNIEGFPMVMRPYQTPRPPLWYGLSHEGSAAWCAENDVNVVTLGSAAMAKGPFDRYRKEWAALGKADKDLPAIALNRQIVIADTDAEAMRIAEPAFRKWRASLSHLWDQKGVPFPFPFPETFEAQLAAGQGVAGTVRTVRDALARQMEQCGANAVLGQMMFGTMAHDDALRSLELFAREVVPGLEREMA